MYDFAKEMHFDVKGPDNKSTRDRALKKLIKSTAILAPGNSTRFLASDPDGLCDRLKLLSQEKHAGNNSNIINEELFAIVGNLLEYKCVSKEQLKQSLIKCNLL